MLQNKRSYFSFKWLYFIILPVLLIVSCDPPQEETETERFEKELNNFNQRMDNIGQSMQILDAMQTELDELERLRAQGEISDAEYSKRSNDVKETFGRAIARRDRTKPVSGLPNWALQLGLSEPQGLVLDQEFSQITSVDNKDEGYNSVMFVYSGNYDLAMKEAERIARQARIPISKDYLDATELIEKFGSNPIKGITYMNFDPFVRDAPVNISITVDETGILTLSAVDVEQMKRMFERQRPND